MEFEDMQVVWNSQTEEKMYAINETALHAHIKRKGKSVNRLVALFEWVMIAVNLLVGIVLMIDALADSGQVYEYVLPALYLAYSVYALFRRLARRKEVVRFDQTMLGELDKAIWQVDYLIKQSRSIILWYLLPLVLVASITMILNDKPFWALGLVLFVTPFSYFGSRWEINKWYLPKKRDLESLREMINAPSVSPDHKG